MDKKFSKGGTGTLVKIAFRNIGRNRRRTLFCISAVAIAVFFIVIYSSLIDGMTDSINKITQIFDRGHVHVVSKQYEAESEYMPVQYPVASSVSQSGENWKEIAAEIKENIPGVRAVLPRIETMATLQESTIKHATLWGLDIEEETQANNLNISARTDGLVKGRWPSPGSNECAIGVVFEHKSGLTIGDSIPLKTISAQFSDKYWSPQIVGIFELDYIKFDERYIIVDHLRLQRLLVLGDATQSLFIYIDDEKASPAVTLAVQNLLGEDNVVSDWQESYWVSVMKMATYIYTFVFFIFLTVASFLIINTVVMIIHERIKEIGMMGSLGMTRGEIVKVFFFESVFLAILGACAGILIGGLITGTLQNFPIRMGDLYGNTFADMPLSQTIFFQFSAGKLLYAFLLGVGVATLFTLFPSLKSARVEPVEALRR